ncbi:MULTISPECIES: hypothetical protein [Bradyrhizobium]|uniref:hypothetical protein n=1 Tax=Bradyrhizobium TaxID=374 RepID=UPI0015CF0F07|nr:MULTISPECIES: hypothetical protein [Bradyrhizobium]
MTVLRALKQLIKGNVTCGERGVQPIFRRKHGNKPALPMRAQNHTRIAGETPRLVPSERRMQRSMSAQRAKLLPDLWTLLEHNEEQICPWFQNVGTLRGLESCSLQRKLGCGIGARVGRITNPIVNAMLDQTR